MSFRQSVIPTWLGSMLTELRNKFFARDVFNEAVYQAFTTRFLYSPFGYWLLTDGTVVMKKKHWLFESCVGGKIIFW